MFIGHEAVALAVKRIAPRTSLGTLFMAVGWLDLVWPVFLLLGVEHVQIDPGNTAFTPLDFVDYPYTHSLLFAGIWAIAFGTVYFLIRRDYRASFIAAAAVLSHWALDAIVHRPDLLLRPRGDIRIGLGLWNSIPGTLIVEIAMFAVGIIIYLRSTTAGGAIGKISFWSFVIVLMAIYFGSINSPPPNERVLAYMALLGWLPVIWGYWIDRTRRMRAVVEDSRKSNQAAGSEI
jgi:LexA-binding, inner membrane-associated putative hydrolase